MFALIKRTKVSLLRTHRTQHNNATTSSHRSSLPFVRFPLKKNTITLSRNPAIVCSSLPLNPTRARVVRCTLANSVTFVQPFMWVRWPKVNCRRGRYAGGEKGQTKKRKDCEIYKRRHCQWGMELERYEKEQLRATATESDQKRREALGMLSHLHAIHARTRIYRKVAILRSWPSCERWLDNYATLNFPLSKLHCSGEQDIGFT